MAWLANPLVPIALLGAAMLACTVLLLALKREIAENRASQRAEYQLLETAVTGMRASLEQLRQAVEDSEQQAAAAARPRPGMNLTKRGQVLRMHRRGENPGQIAAALSLPLGEVELLVKVHRMNQPPAAN